MDIRAGYAELSKYDYPDWFDGGEMKNEKSVLEERRRAIIAYLYVKITEEDWHGCADAAMDLREIDAKLSIIKERE